MQWINDNQGILAVIGIVITLILAYLSYLTQRRNKRLEYVVVSNELVVPKAISNKLKVTYNNSRVDEASVMIVRIVNTGNVPISPSDFMSDLSLKLTDAHAVKAALSTRTRPADLAPKLSIDTNHVRVKPVLINPGDLIELKLLASGLASCVELVGRIIDTQLVVRKELPFSAGSGSDGEILESDRRTNFFVRIILMIMISGFIWIDSSTGLDFRGKLIVIVETFILCFVIYPLYMRLIVKRRAFWT